MAGDYEIAVFAEEPIEVLIGNLRSGIASDCGRLLQTARKLNFERRGFNLKRWESQISRIREAELATYSLKDLKSLRKDCRDMSTQLAAFDK